MKRTAMLLCAVMACGCADSFWENRESRLKPGDEVMIYDGATISVQFNEDPSRPPRVLGKHGVPSIVPGKTESGQLIAVENGSLGRVVDDTQTDQEWGRDVGVRVLDGSQQGRVLYFQRVLITPRKTPSLGW